MYIDGVEKWEKSSEDNKTRKTITVYKAENGYVVSHCVYNKPKDGENMDIIKDREDTKLYISKTNPLEGMDKAEEKFKINIETPAKEGEIIIED